MARAVADASVVIKWFADEEHSDRARELLEDFVDREVDLLAPTLLRYEVLNGIRWKKGSNASALQKVDSAMHAFGIHLAPLEGGLSQRAIDLSLKYDLTLYDASYLALAMGTADCTLWSADDRFLQKLDDDISARHIREYRGKLGRAKNGRHAD